VQDRIPQKVAGIAAILFVIALLVSIFALTPSHLPKPNDSAARWASYIGAHRSTLQAGDYVGGIGFVAALFFISALSNFFARIEGALRGPSTLILSGGVAAVTVAAVGGTLSVLLHYRTGPGSDLNVVRALVDASNLAFVIIGFPIAVWLAGAGISTLRNGGLPRWYAWLSIAFGVVNLLGASAVATHGTFGNRGAFGGVAFAGFIGLMLWSLITGVLMLRSGFGSEPAGAPA
jgi:hypothetical protein